MTDWKNLEKATRSLPDLRNHSCVAGIDYSKTNDFVAAGLLFKVGDKRYWMHHTWVCKKSRDLPRIKYPLKEAEEEGVEGLKECEGCEGLEEQEAELRGGNRGVFAPAPG